MPAAPSDSRAFCRIVMERMPRSAVVGIVAAAIQYLTKLHFIRQLVKGTVVIGAITAVITSAAVLTDTTKKRL